MVACVHPLLRNLVGSASENLGRGQPAGRREERRGVCTISPDCGVRGHVCSPVDVGFSVRMAVVAVHDDVVRFVLGGGRSVGVCAVVIIACIRLRAVVVVGAGQESKEGCCCGGEDEGGVQTTRGTALPWRLCGTYHLVLLLTGCDFLLLTLSMCVCVPLQPDRRDAMEADMRHIDEV